jgi:hypothetical protein
MILGTQSGYSIRRRIKTRAFATIGATLQPRAGIPSEEGLRLKVNIAKNF